MVDSDDRPTVAVATRTLIASGFQISEVQRQPGHIEFAAERIDIFAATIRYLIVIMESNDTTHLEHLKKRADRDRRTLVIVTPKLASSTIGWCDFLSALGGAVPAWRALVPEYSRIVETLGANQLPEGYTGEPWSLFEEATADAIEFLLGRRVTRLGGRQRGEPLPDFLARTPDRKILVVDAKSSSQPFNVGVATLRPLREYFERQSIRQQGDSPVSSVLLIANHFKQSDTRLLDLANQFLTGTRASLAFLHTSDLVAMVQTLQEAPSLRNKIRWSQILCGLGKVSLPSFQAEVANAASEKI